MNRYIKQFKEELSDYSIRSGGDDDFSVLDLLWQGYLESNPFRNKDIRKKEYALRPIYNELSIKSSDILNELICELCTAYQRAAFMEGVQIGFRLNEELTAE